MKARKKDDILKRRVTIKVVESDFGKMLDNDPVFIKKREDAVRDLLENPPPEWILKRMRGED
ncbi:hypothetical protein Q4E93_26845 [Flavitalea sp. BT771]|uniref:hypothetical protein n=1 Tax=Flavitalea sp. BT771 TaxID=3063329 RepID=UPI0026E4556A|nr:hypothetical protein [Flavitalea sp. BT771]MDO6434257.1 hypothetical protein [Flavitalea sp. BT771]MDV6223157.1 hypothetical protein [Flavitalea sp. BT771]